MHVFVFGVELRSKERENPIMILKILLSFASTSFTRHLTTNGA